MKLTLFKKIVIIVCVASSLFVCSVVPCFANTTIPSSGSVKQMKPFFYPDYILASSSDGMTCTDMSTISAIPTADLGVIGLAYTDTVIYPVNGDPNVPAVIYQSTLTKTSNSLTGYTYNYFRGSVESDILIHTLGINNLRFGFTDIWIPPSLAKVGQTFDWFGNVGLSDYVYNEPLTANSIVCSYRMSYVDPQVSNQLYTVNSSFTLPELSNFRDVTSVFRSILNSMPSSALENGVLIDWLTVDLVGLPSGFNGFSVYGDIKFIDASNNGTTQALNAWAKYYDRTEVVNVTTPTVLESVTLGINSIMDMELFGLWSLGEIFIAALTIPLCIWLLRLFAGG